MISSSPVSGTKWTCCPVGVRSRTYGQVWGCEQLWRGQTVMAWLGQNKSRTAAPVGCSQSAGVSIYQEWSKEGTEVNQDWSLLDYKVYNVHVKSLLCLPALCCDVLKTGPLLGAVYWFCSQPAASFSSPARRQLCFHAASRESSSLCADRKCSRFGLTPLLQITESDFLCLSLCWELFNGPLSPESCSLVWSQVRRFDLIWSDWFCPVHIWSLWLWAGSLDLMVLDCTQSRRRQQPVFHVNRSDGCISCEL